MKQEEKTKHMKGHKIQIGIGILGIIISISLCFFGWNSYLKKQRIQFAAIKEMELQELLKRNRNVDEKGSLELKPSSNELDSILYHWVTKNPSKLNITNLHYDSDNEKLYLEAKKNKNTYTFSIKSKLEFRDNTVTLNLDKVKLGSLELPYSLKKFKELTNMEDALVISIENDNLFYLAEIKDNGKTMVFKYDEEKLLKLYQDILANIDDVRTMLHTENDDINKLFLQLAFNKGITFKEAIECQNLFYKNKDNIKEFTCILNENGIEELVKQFDKSLLSDSDKEDYKELYEKDVNLGISNYHDTFSKYFFQYLYNHKGYELTQSTIEIEGEALDYRAVFAEFNDSNLVCEIDLKMKESKLYAIYKSGNERIEKLLLTRR